MAEIFYLPQMGQTMTEATILKWLKQEGDRVEGWEAVAEMMTDKINMEVDTQISGTLRKILAPEGAVVPVGAPIAILGAPDEDISALLTSLGSAGDRQPAATDLPASSPAAGVEAAAGRSAAPPPPPAAPDRFPSVSPRAREAASEGGIAWQSLSLPGTGFEGMIVERDVLQFLASGQPPSEIRSTPLAAKMAQELGVSLEDMVGSGSRGRVRAEDVRQAASRRKAPAIEAREVPLQGMRKVIAGRLAASYQQAVHVPLRVDADMTAAAEIRRQLKPVFEPEGARLTYTDLIAAAAAQALVAVPTLNATLEKEVIRIHPSVNLGIAVALEEGLTVPVIRDAHTLPLRDLSLAIQEAAAGARARTLGAEAYAGGTFTISNLGQFGVDSFDPILNPPQVAILGVGRIQDRVVAVGGAPAVRPMMTLTLTFDHRATDGAPAAQLLSLIRELLENPARLLV